jgi:primosomal protein N' (replication factor Y) (superfamily II helicase)
MVARVTLEIALRKEFDYAIPPELAGQIEVGSRVKVPFGPRQVFGVVTAVLEDTATTHTHLRPLLRVIGRQSQVTPKVLRLARWIADYYCCPPEIALKSVLPEAVRQEKDGWRERLFVRLAPRTGDLPKLTARQMEVWKIVETAHELPLQRLQEMCGCAAETVRRLEDKGLLTIAAQVTERDPYAHEQILPTQPLALNCDQARALQAIREAMDADATGAPPSAPAGLPINHPSLGLRPTPSPRPAGRGQGEGDLLGGSTSQCAIQESWRLPPAASKVFLLHGVTGSGKTEVYLQALAHALAQGKGAVVLVPEISLTPQTVERFKARFSSGPLQTLVAVLHSHLSAGERHDEWHKIRQGRARIVIGARSAIFAPVDPLGLIIVDEEHEHSYKQEEAPRYHARDVAVVRGRMESAVVVLGSATPSLESFYNVRRGKYALLELPQRADDKKMPLVRVIDLRQTAKVDKGTPIFSPRLKEAIQQRLERKEQVILFLNRRGYSTSLQCPKCGFVAQCPDCSVALTYHRQTQKLLCHTCGHQAPAPAVCPDPACRNPAIRYAGLGTQKVEATLAKLFPHARIKRMDSDALQRKEDYRRILGDFRTGKVDILVGTQMIAKGLHFPNVTLVGIIHADLGLHLADFRAGERTFQLLTQVAGRAGRGDVEGEVFVQSFTPFHPAIQYARRHDFLGFYEQEIEFRAQLRYPPVARAALLTLKGRNEEKVKFSAEHARKELEKQLAAAAAGDEPPARPENEDLFSAPAGVPAVGLRVESGAGRPFSDVILAGPAPAPLARAETFYRYQLMLRTRQMSKLSRLLAKFSQTVALPEDVTLTIDIDPVSLL